MSMMTMNSKSVYFAVFVKPWKKLAIAELARFIRQMGFEWIELPVRPGFPCEPETIEKTLPEAVRVLGEEGVQVLNITASLPLTDERLYNGSLKAGVKMNRVIFERQEGENYWDAEKHCRKTLDEASVRSMRTRSACKTITAGACR
jgi:hypothetical protein